MSCDSVEGFGDIFGVLISNSLKALCDFDTNIPNDQEKEYHLLLLNPHQCQNFQLVQLQFIHKVLQLVLGKTFGLEIKTLLYWFAWYITSYNI